MGTFHQFVAVTALLTLPLCASVKALTPAAGSAAVRAWGRGEVAQGYRLYVSAGCYQCHGYVGQGSKMTGPALIPLSGNDAYIAGYVRSPRGLMPPFSARVLSPSALNLIIVYIHSLKPGRPAKEIALLKPYLTDQPPPSGVGLPAAGFASTPSIVGGKADYLTHCAVCHGANREGGIGPRLTNEGASHTLDQVIGIILNPPQGMPKLSPRPLAPDAIRGVAAYVRSAH